MRDFYNLGLLQKIDNNPLDYIVQRKVNLLDSFLFGYENILLTIENIEILKSKYTHIPSIQEYAIEKYNGQKIGTRGFSGILKYNSENELEYYNNYLLFIREYETKYPLEGIVRFIINDKPKNTLKDVLAAMKARFPMYFGCYELENFRAFFDGYIKSKRDYNIALDDFESKIVQFTEKIKCNIIDMEGENITWDRKYRYNMCLDAWGPIMENQAKGIINKFFKELEDNIGEKII